MKFIYRFKQIILLTGDFIIFFLALVLALTLRNFYIPSFDTITTHILLFVWLFLIWIVINYIIGLYDLNLINNEKKYNRLMQAYITNLIIGILFFYVIPNKALSPKTLLVITITISYIGIGLWRIFNITFIEDKKRSTNILWIGNSKEMGELINIIEQQPNLGFTNRVIINNIENSDLPKSMIHYTNVNDILAYIPKHHIQLVITDFHIEQQRHTQDVLYPVLFSSAKIIDLASFYESITGRIPPRVFSEIWFIKNLRNIERPVYDKLRRVSDIIAATILSIVSLPFVLLIIPLIKFSSEGPVIFTQKRMGKNNKVFKIYKFRTMYALSADGSAETDGAQFASKNDLRITNVGKILRKIRLDEIPQIWNLLRGDVTLIGPRPERPEIVEQLTRRLPYYPLRHTIKPGITGWAAIHQHYTDTLETSLQKLQYDLYYIKNRSVLVDLSIVLKTINVVMRGLGQ